MKKNILAIGGLWHEGSMAYLKEGNLSYLAVERINRDKYSGLHSTADLYALLKVLNVDLPTVDSFIWVGKDDYKSVQIYGNTVRDWFRKIAHETIHIVDHHDAHMASSYYSSPFDESIILSIDDVGDSVSARLAIGRENTITEIDSMKTGFSLGRLWEGVNTIFGFNPANDSGKSMALSAWSSRAKYVKEFESLVQPHGFFYQYNISKDFPQILATMCSNTFNGNQVIANYISTICNIPFASKHIIERYGESTNYDYLQQYYDLAYSLQVFTNNLIASIVSRAIKKYGIKNVCLAGGVGLNGVTNGYLLENTEVASLHVPPMTSDCGLSIGGVFWARNMIYKDYYRSALPFVPYSGPSFSSDVERALLKYRNKINSVKDLNCLQTAAKLINEGNIIGWYQGAAEVGPRSLGNRSILAHPGIPGIKDKINRIIKKRESFRPFAPSVLEEHLKEFFDVSYKLSTSPYMLFVVKTNMQKLNTISQVTHKDGTARVQTVSKKMNTKYYNLITEFYKLSGIPLVLNTSFNDSEEPIVHTPEDAIKCFLENDLDFLILEDYVISVV